MESICTMWTVKARKWRVLFEVNQYQFQFCLSILSFDSKVDKNEVKDFSINLHVHLACLKNGLQNTYCT